MVRFVRFKYLQSKRDTQALSTWLIQAALQFGYPADKLQRSSRPLGTEEEQRTTGQQAKNACKKAKQKARKKGARKGVDAVGAEGGQVVEDGTKDVEVETEVETGEKKDSEQKGKSESANLQGDYELQSHQYVELAQFLVKENAPVATEFMQLIRRCVRLRHQTVRSFLPKRDASTRSHEFFIDVLREVSSLFTQHRQAQARATALAAGHAEPSASQTNRFASLADLDSIEEEQGEEEMPDIQLPEAPRKPGLGISAARVRCNLQDTKASAMMMLLTFFADLDSVRVYIRELWTDYRDHKVDLLTASVTANTALELLRKPHDDIVERAMPFFDDDVGCAITFVANFLLVLHFGSSFKPLLPMPLFNDLKQYSLDVFGKIYDYLYLPNLQMLLGLAPIMNNGNVPLYKPGYFGHFDPTIDFERADYNTRWSQALVLMTESYPDYITIMTAWPMLLQHLKDPSPEFASRMNSEGERATQRANPFGLDEMAIEMDLYSQSRKCTLMLAFHSAVFIDTNFILRSSAKRGMAELRASSLRILATLEKRDKIEGAVKPPLWLPEYEKSIETCRNEAELWTQKDDLITQFRKISASAIAGADESRYVSYLMERNPAMCGLLLFRLQLQYQHIGLALSNCWRIVQYTAHLVVACRHSGNASTAALQQPLWADMDKILEIHKATDVFGGKIPETAAESQASFLRTAGASFDLLLTQKYAGTDAALPSRLTNPARTPEFSFKGHKCLEDHTQISLIFKKRYFGDSKTTYIDINVIETLLSDMRARQEADEEKAARKGAQGGSAGTRKLLRKERSHRSAKFSLPQLLAVLEAGLRLETESIRFDWISMHLRCLEALRAVKVATDGYLTGKFGPNWMENDTQLISLVGLILHVATMSGRAAELTGVTRSLKPGLELKSKLLVSATQALTAFLASRSNEADAEIRKLRLYTASK